MTTRLPALICVKADAAELSGDPLLLEGELVRRGARDAHLTADGHIAVSVVAKTQSEACALVDALLRKARDRSTGVETGSWAAPTSPAASLS